MKFPLSSFTTKKDWLQKSPFLFFNSQLQDKSNTNTIYFLSIYFPCSSENEEISQEIEFHSKVSRLNLLCAILIRGLKTYLRIKNEIVSFKVIEQLLPALISQEYIHKNIC